MKPQHAVVRRELLGSLAAGAHDLALEQRAVRHADRRRDLLREPLLDREEVLDIEPRVERLSPQLRAVLDVDEPRCHADHIAGVPHAAGQHVVRAEFGPNRLEIRVFVAVRHARRVR